MAMNRVQFQPGLSTPQFLRQSGTAEQCETALWRLRWPQGFGCQGRGETHHCVLRVGRGRSSSAESALRRDP
jgi:hypothetical protein